MKRSFSETAFIVVLLAISAAGIFLFVNSRRPSAEELEVYYEEPDEAESYSVDVINAASPEDFMEVSGIGEVKAGQIVAFRDAIGGFRSVRQLKEVGGVSDKLYERIIEHFYGQNTPEPDPAETEPPKTEPVTAAETKKTEKPAKSEKSTSPAPKETKAPETTAATVKEETEIVDDGLRSVNINAASAEEIASALGLSDDQAEQIVGLREKIDYFSTPEELYLLDFMNKEIYRRIKDFILFE